MGREPEAAAKKKHEADGTQPSPAADAEPGKGKGKSSKKDLGELELGGRVFVLETAASVADGPWRGALAVASARFELRYHWKRVRAVVELEAAQGDAELRDGYLKLDLPERLELRAGQFKIPLSPIENQSVWSLPSVSRGMLSDVLDDSFHVTGRRAGLSLEWRGRGDDARPSAVVGVFQGEGFGGDPAAGAPGDVLGVDAVARASLKWKRPATELELGAGGSWRVMQPTAIAAPERYWAASLDGQLEHTWCGMGVRAWLEGFVGTSTFDTTPETTGDPVFVAARGLVAWRRGGMDQDDWYVEPYALASAVDANLDNADDAAYELTGGVAGGQWRRWRVQVQLEVWRESALTPPTLQAGGVDLADREAVLVQLGAGF